MLDSRVCALPVPAAAAASPMGGMSLLGDLPLLDRLDRGAAGLSMGLGVGLGLGPPPATTAGFRPLPPRLWRPTVWGSPPPPPSPCRPPPALLPPPPPPSLPLCPEPCHVPGSLAGVGVTHLFDYVASARLWYPWYYKGDSLLGPGSPTCPATTPLDTATSCTTYDLATAAAAAAAAAAASSSCCSASSSSSSSSCASSSSSSSSCKDLPTRGLKGDRVKDRGELGQVLHLDKEHAASLCAARKAVTATASTQTQFSSFNGEAPPYPGPPPGPPPAYFAPRGDDPHPRDSYSHHPLYGPPPPLRPLPHTSPMSTSSPPSSSHLVDLSHAHVASSSDVQNAPLNLSLSNSPLPPVSLSVSASSAWQPHRSSVITSMSSSSSPMSSGGSSPRGHHEHRGNNGRSSPGGNSHPVSDPAIEEHFRRSLASYGDSVPKTTVSSTTALESNVSITGSVDDHFAKALGDSTWKALKSQSETAPEIFTGSVDDHFAKALGATTWRRIKAEKEHSESAGSAAINSGDMTVTATATNSNNTPATTNHSSSHSSSSSSPSHSSSSLSAPVAS